MQFFRLLKYAGKYKKFLFGGAFLTCFGSKLIGSAEDKCDNRCCGDPAYRKEKYKLHFGTPFVK